MVSHHSVLIYDGHYVGRYADGNQVKQRLKLIVIAQTVALGKSLHELEADATSAEVGARVCASRHLRIEYGHGRRQLIIGHMVVADYEVDAVVAGILYLLDSLYAAVKYYDELHLIFDGIINAFSRDAVSLFVAGGYIIFYVAVIILQIFIYQGYGCGAVDIIVAIHHYALLGAHSFVQAFHGLVHVRHQERVMQVGNGRRQKSLGSPSG